MKHLTILLFSLLYTVISAQKTWSSDVAQIFYNKCASCHHTGGIGGFSLQKHSEVSPMAYAISNAISTDKMPPWPPSKKYQKYMHDRSLSDTEKQTVLDWIKNGTPEGNSAQTPPLPIFPEGAMLAGGDLTVKIPKYMSKASSGKDDYVCFSVPTGLTEKRSIKAIEIVPGNRKIVHHALIFIDQTAAETTDSTSGKCSSPGNPSTVLVAGYTPGATPVTFPNKEPLKLGVSIEAGAKIYFTMHYPEGSYGEFDSTKVIFHFYPKTETGIREVSAAAVIQNWNFTLPPNVKTAVSASYKALPSDISLLSVFPHMHLLGESIKSYGISPSKDTVKFIDVPKWDFHWQDFFFFKNIVFAPKGTVIKGEGIYDNTSNNPNNPNNPPVTVVPGLNTANEMFLVYFHYMLHQAGDENYDMESLITASLSEALERNNESIKVYPNPAESEVNLSIPSKIGSQITCFIYDSKGEIVRKLTQTEITTEKSTITWDGKNEAGSDVRPGIYFFSVNAGGEFMNAKVVKN
jgi:hypothetical protein